jgi:hypothetical protein
MSHRLAALDTVSACLAVDKGPREIEALRLRLASPRVHWPTLIELANKNLVTPALWAELCRLQLDDGVPGEVRDYLEEVHRLNAERNRRLREQTLEILRVLNTLGVEPILLKGVASLFVDTYPSHCPRILTDIDILVPQQHAQACWELLLDHRYVAIGDDYDFSRHNHLRPLARPGEYATLEIHRTLIQPSATGRLFGIALSAAAVERLTALLFREARSLRVEGATLRIPSPTCRVIHCALHSAFAEHNAYRSGLLPLRQLYELALLQQRFAEEIDWEGIALALGRGGKMKVFRAWLYLAHRLFGSRLPGQWRTSASMAAHYVRCRLQARWGLYLTLKQLRQL